MSWHNGADHPARRFAPWELVVSIRSSGGVCSVQWPATLLCLKSFGEELQWTTAIKSDKRPQSSRSQQWGRRPGQFAADEKCQILQDPGDHGEICYIRATTKRQLLQSCCGDNIISSWLGRCGGDHWWLKARVPSGHLVSSNLAVENRHLQQVYKSFTRWLSMEGLNRVCHKIADLSPIGTWGEIRSEKIIEVLLEMALISGTPCNTLVIGHYRPKHGWKCWNSGLSTNQIGDICAPAGFLGLQFHPMPASAESGSARQPCRTSTRDCLKIPPNPTENHRPSGVPIPMAI